MEVYDLVQIGDRVFYPMHGAGIIKAIEEREILGKTEEYCVINIPICKMDVMIPMNKIHTSGIRSLVDRKTMKEILLVFHHENPHNSIPWKERYSLNMEKMKTGDVHDSVEIVRDLLFQSKEKSLNSSERHMLNQARRNLISELVLIADLTENQAANLLKLSS
ncbi:CarD family transcriptional regulator [Peribacillus asahii]|uniref:CarD family transcriptional regulator n=1 Tax=Peribacillus asahii TaxID=228899 RepID=UPI00382B19CD